MRKIFVLFVACLVAMHVFTLPVIASNRGIEKMDSEDEFLDIVESHPIFIEHQNDISVFVSFNEFDIESTNHRNAVYLLKNEETDTVSYLMFIENGGQLTDIFISNSSPNGFTISDLLIDTTVSYRYGPNPDCSTFICSSKEKVSGWMPGCSSMVGSSCTGLALIPKFG